MTRNFQARLSDVVQRIIIVAYKEDTTALEDSFRAEGFSDVIVLRPQYTKEELEYSRQSRCLLNHREAWRLCANSEGLSIIVEADFVPVRGIGALPLVFPIEQSEKAWGWLYSCGHRVYELIGGHFIRGHSATTVAYVIGPDAASKVIPFVQEEFSNNSPKAYSPWDTYIRMFAQKRGVNMFLPYRSYGEHGGIPNSEHKVHGITQSHQADVLWGSLHFMPAYSRGSWTRYVLTRARAKLVGFARLVTGRYVEWPTIMNQKIPLSQRGRMVMNGFVRLLYPY